jgi:hypothetical protein
MYATPWSLFYVGDARQICRDVFFDVLLHIYLQLRCNKSEIFKTPKYPAVVLISCYIGACQNIDVLNS